MTCWAVLAAAPALATDLPAGERTFKVAIDREYEPYEFLDEEVATGFTPALLRAIGAKAGVRFEFVPLTWPEAMDALEGGEVDLLSMIPTPDRLGRFEFSSPHSRVTQAIFRNQSSTDISDLASLKGQVVGLQRGDVAEEQLRERGDFERRFVNSKLEGLLLVHEGRLKAFVCAQQAGVHLIAANGLNQVDLGMTELFPQDLAFAAHLGNRELITLLDSQLAQMLASGELEALRDQWLAGKIPQRSWLDRYGWFLLATGAGLLLVLGLVLLWNWNLRRAVQDRTAALRDSQALLASSQELAHVGSWELDRVSQRLTLSEEVYRLLGVPSRDFDPTWAGFLGLVHPDDRAALDAAYSGSLEQGGPPAELEHRVVRRGTAEVRDVSERWIHLRDGGGQVVRSIGMVQDVTEQKRSEQQHLRLEAQLQQAQKMESVGRLAGGVAHDFNNMLTVILGNVEVALLRLGPANPLQAELGEIKQASERSAHLIRQLLTFARVQTVAPQVVNLNETVAAALNMLRRLIGENIQLTWRPGESLWPVRVDPSQVDQILTNLCVNARHAIADVGKLTIETGNAVLDEDGLRPGVVPGEYVRLTVSDDGCGMDSQTLAHIFEPFFTTKAVGQGTGLGLALVYGAIKQNHGFIEVDSAVGSGTTFRLFLPRHQGALSPGEPKEPAAAARGKETVLVVEDEPAILRLAVTILGAQGYRVIAASTPAEAIRLAQEHDGELQLLLSDVVMPEMNGRDLARALVLRHPRLKLLFMSGFSADLLAPGMLDRKSGFIQKPFSVEELTATVRATLDS